MFAIEIFCGVIVLSYVATRAHSADDRRGFLTAFAWLAVAAAVAESSCVWLYGFYSYNSDWTVFVGPVPLMVVLIWPCVVISAWDISRHLSRKPWWRRRRRPPPL